MQNLAFYRTNIGTLEVRANSTHITYLKFAPNATQVDFEKSNPSELTDLAILQIREYLAKKLQKFDLPIDPKGTDFQKSVWQELQKIPYGETRSYSDVALSINNPKAVRALGMANNKNPIVIIIPCHRVIGKNGKLVGYAGGLDLKQKLLDLEKY